MVSLKDFFKNIFSISDYGPSGNTTKITILGIKIKFVKKAATQNMFTEFKDSGGNVTDCPKATGKLREIQLKLLDILVELDRVCKENNIRYWLDGGTMIGAVRHKGFIPWDDDIDTGMIYSDYLKIKDIFNEQTANEDYYCDYFRDPLKTSSCYLKIISKSNPQLFVDIFPFEFYHCALDEQGKTKLSIAAFELKNYLAKKCTRKMDNETVLKIMREEFDKKILENKTANEEDKPTITWSPFFPHRWKNRFYDYDTFFPLKEIEFEGRKFSTIANPNDYLTGVYGDYMNWPKKIFLNHINLKEV